MIGAVYIHGHLAPTLVSEKVIRQMEPGSAVVDVAVDQGGCIETIHPTTHSDPTYLVGGVVHYGVANMPGAVPHTSTRALTNATLPYVMKLANAGIDAALGDDSMLASGVNVYKGKIVCEGVAEASGATHVPLDSLI